VKSKSDSNGSHAMPAPNCAGKRFAIAAARFYRELTDSMIDGARRALADCGVKDEDILVYDVPGCFELPLACRKIIGKENVDGLVALGVVIRGETAHFDFVAGQCAEGIMTVQLATNVPIGFGVLTTENMEQALERADPKQGDKGYEAALAAASLVALGQQHELPRAGFRS
jgi:6,7-dimethyl-8-ribityllumazine synthase